MSTNKHQFIRYQALDKCFANKGRRYFIDDLIKACNTALYEYTGDPMYNGSMPAVSRRTLYNDIDFMKSEKGWSAPIKRGIKDRKAYYQYEDSNFTINNQPLSQNEMEHLKEATLMLSRFKGLPSFEWVEDIITTWGNGGVGFVNKKLEEISKPQFSAAGSFKKGVAAVKQKTGKWGFIDKKGKTVVPFVFDNIISLSGGKFQVEVGPFVFITK